MGYLFWIFGCFGAHRFYYGKPFSGVLWLFTLGLLGIGWIVDLFYIPAMQAEASRQFHAGETDYGLAWVMLTLGGVFGIHRFYMGDFFFGVVYLVTGGLFSLGVFYDAFTLNDQISLRNYRAFRHGVAAPGFGY